MAAAGAACEDVRVAEGVREDANARGEGGEGKEGGKRNEEGAPAGPHLPRAGGGDGRRGGDGDEEERETEEDARGELQREGDGEVPRHRAPVCLTEEVDAVAEDVVLELAGDPLEGVREDAEVSGDQLRGRPGGPVLALGPREEAPFRAEVAPAVEERAEEGEERHLREVAAEGTERFADGTERGKASLDPEPVELAGEEEDGPERDGGRLREERPGGPERGEPDAAGPAPAPSREEGVELAEEEPRNGHVRCREGAVRQDRRLRREEEGREASAPGAAGATPEAHPRAEEDRQEKPGGKGEVAYQDLPGSGFDRPDQCHVAETEKGQLHEGRRKDADDEAEQGKQQHRHGHRRLDLGGPAGTRRSRFAEEDDADDLREAGGRQVLVGGLLQPGNGLLPVLRGLAAQIQELGQGELGLGIARLRQLPDFPRIVSRGRAEGGGGTQAGQRQKEQNTPDRPVQNWYDLPKFAMLAERENVEQPPR